MSEPTPSSQPVPVVVRTDLRPIGADAVAAAVAAVAAWVAGLGVVAFAALGWLVFALAGRARMRAGRSVIGPDGLLLESAGRQRTIVWDASWTFTVRDGLRFRYATVENATFRPHRVPGLVTSRWRPSPELTAALDAIEQAARRHPGDLGVVSGRRLPPWLYAAAIVALLGAAAIVERPWYWFAPARVSAPPAPCTVLDAATAQRLGVTLPGQPVPDVSLPGAPSCEWTGPGGTLTLTLTGYDRFRVRSGTAVADLRFDDNPFPSDLYLVTQPDVGDEARLLRPVVEDASGQQTLNESVAYLVARRSNELAVVTWHGTTPPGGADASAAIVTGVARSVLAAS